MIFTSFLFTGCEKKEDKDDISNVPLTGTLNIFIEWSTDPDRFGEGGMQWWGKADITVNITGIEEVSDGFYTLDGEGSGSQYASDAFVASPSWIENLATPAFTVEIETGVFSRGVGYGITLWTENADFSFDVVEDRDGAIYRWPQQPNELKNIINNALILDLQEKYNYICALYDTTILGTAYHAVASFASR
ncbi:MAG TPA: hypothetical protein VJ346_07560 [Bacteroidales bacterium]|nr:hypothetical protein [Bacteroidales bacterium]